ncbi:hypothetical protein DMN91_004651 [Ooceraea biroi]|uniref:Carboxypeptidase inhibitor SmCI n=1 Tax=Ooceraea biroi TaxID=2015173 RepID=A0A026WJG2_OOCBI|nr:trypsin inhibitor [Ooceraea biroi]EZA55259.1 Carboxypeptidase inhibitor SmCI [Ooceraea biroi]RLU22373.1 hypothetical protein DMN91_004651 [Ooceraea biroi]
MGLKTCLLFAFIVVGVLMHVDAKEEKTETFVQPLFCSLRAEAGLCKGHFRKYAWDAVSGKCVEFLYGGCFGNANNFQTKEECEQMCSSATHKTD